LIRRRFLGPVVIAVGFLHAAHAHAEPSTQEKALASRLFDDASKLVASGQTAAACPKYAESERLDPQLGTLLHLGECYANVGKAASAWTSFKEAADIATQRSDPRAGKIRDRLASVEKTVSNLVITVDASEPATLEVRQDGDLVGKAVWGSPIPVDPGEHKISATAPGAKPREVVVTVGGKGQTATVSLPPIEYLPATVATPTTPSTPDSTTPTTEQKSPTTDTSRSWFSSHQRVVGVVVGAIGVAGIGVGSAFGLTAKSTYDKSDAHCNGDHCDPTGHDFRQSAFSKAEVSDIAFGVGGAALVGGVVLFLTAPKAEQAAVITPVVGPNLAFLSLRRSF
jgi:hypothetical protein